MSQPLPLKFGRQAISVEEARDRVRSHLRLTGVEEVPLAGSFGRMTAKPLYAAHPVPHFRRSGVDGYAVRAADLQGCSPQRPARLKVIEHIPCGAVPRRAISAGEAARIMTGAPVPEGADAVVMLEMTDSAQAGGSQPSAVAVYKELPAGSNITPIAGEVAAGELLLPRGTRIGPGEAALLAAFGQAAVAVHRKPRAAIFSTGAELLNVGEPLQPGRIRNSNSYMLAAQVEAAGAIPVMMPALPDDAERVLGAIAEALEAADMVLTSGGVSVGDYDVLVDVFERFDGQLLFNKVAMRPGTPTSAALWKGKLLFALSGNPGASFVGFELFVKPALLAMQGSLQPYPAAVPGYLDVDYPKGSAFPRYVRGASRLDSGRLQVRPAGIDKSSIMVSIKDADCLIGLPAGGGGFRKNDKVLVYPIR